MFQFIVVPLIKSELSSSTQTVEFIRVNLRYNSTSIQLSSVSLECKMYCVCSTVHLFMCKAIAFLELMYYCYCDTFGVSCPQLSNNQTG